MNTPPTMSPAPLPMAPVKFNKKQPSKLDIKPKKLMYNDQDVELVSKDAKFIFDKSIKKEEKLQLSEKSKLEDSTDTNFFAKHVEQNELDNEAEISKVDHPYNLRRRNKYPICQHPKLETKKKVVKKKLEEDKENVQDQIASTSGNLSQPEVNLDVWEKLKWLQCRRDVGIWVQCCDKKCMKWRFVEAFHDPIEVPEFWICAMNPSENFSSCNDEIELNYEECKDDLIENVYNAGSLVWGKINGYPWWPAMIDDCPDTLRYYELKPPSSIPVRYHVTFFEETASRAWLTTSRIKPLKENDSIQPVKRGKIIFYGINYTEQIKKELKVAESARLLTITERLEKFSFRTRYLENIHVDPVTKSLKKKSKKKQSYRIGIKKLCKKRKINTKIPPGEDVDHSSELNLLPSLKTNLSSFLKPTETSYFNPALSQNGVDKLQPTQLPDENSEQTLQYKHEESQDLVEDSCSNGNCTLSSMNREEVVTRFRDYYALTGNSFNNCSSSSSDSETDIARIRKYYKVTENPSNSHSSLSFDSAGNLAKIKDYVENNLAPIHKKITGEDLVEGAKLYEESLSRKRAEREREKAKLYFAIEYNDESEISSDESSSSGSEKSDYVFGSQALKPRSILSYSRLVLKKREN